jgi:hypothetical protein
MMSFRGNRLADLRLPLGTVWMLENLAESKGRQALFEAQAPQILKALREMIRKVMNRWRSESRLEMLGKGRDARWRRKD